MVFIPAPALLDFLPHLLHTTFIEQSRKLNIKLSRGGLCSGNKQGGG